MSVKNAVKALVGVVIFHIHHTAWPLLDDDFCIIFQLLREAGTSVMEILKVDVVSFVYIPVQVNPLLFNHGSLVSLFTRFALHMLQNW